MYFGKLVRDRIPSRIQKEGKQITLLSLSTNDPAFKKYLFDKLQEEVQEFVREGDSVELADILEVIDTLLKFPEYSKKDILEMQETKRNQSGGFEKGFILLNVE